MYITYMGKVLTGIERGCCVESFQTNQGIGINFEGTEEGSVRRPWCV